MRICLFVCESESESEFEKCSVGCQHDSTIASEAI
jgi:hypothetical protein